MNDGQIIVLSFVTFFVILVIILGIVGHYTEKFDEFKKQKQIVEQRKAEKIKRQKAHYYSHADIFDNSCEFCKAEAQKMKAEYKKSVM